ncbi:glycosyltransferase family 4 protein [Paenibacillus sp. SI8]|uniref:glycosyltransferase family 4 protein n=1 Tax=unclassified Paenibacillus TaxID=185978 RepID=UPI003466BCD2
MRILVFNTLYYPNLVGGAERSVQLLVEQLRDKGNECIIVTTTDEKDKIDYVNNIKVYYLNFRNLYWGNKTEDKHFIAKSVWHALDVYNPIMKKRISEIVKTEKPDVIYTNNLSGFSVVPWIVAKEANIPVAHTLRDYYLLCVKSSMFNGSDNCNKRCTTCKIYTEYKKNLTNKGYVDHLIGNSHFIVDKHKSEGYFENVPSSRIFNGTTLQSQKQVQTYESKRLTFLYLGRIHETKGVNLLLDIFNKNKDADLILAGYIFDRKIEERINKGEYSANIKFIGYVETKDILPQIDMLIVPSLYHEPLARVVLESYSYGKPVIGSTRGGIPESIDDGKTGFLFDPADKDSLEQIVDSLIADPSQLKELSLNLAEFLEGYDIRRTSDQYNELFQSMGRKEILI